MACSRPTNAVVLTGTAPGRGRPGRLGDGLITGNEDGIKHCASNVLDNLQHIGHCVPLQADAGWIGEAGPGPGPN
jgi:hypothetical protein